MAPDRIVWTRLTRSSVLKQVHPDTGISNRAMSILNSFVNGESIHTLETMSSDYLTD